MKSLAMEAEGVSALQRRFRKSNAVVNERNQGDLYGLGLMTVSWLERGGSFAKRSTMKAESGLRSLGATLPMRWDSRMRSTCEGVTINH
jgi:hypothetical protein